MRTSAMITVLLALLFLASTAWAQVDEGVSPIPREPIEQVWEYIEIPIIDEGQETTLRFALVLPRDFDPAATYPAIVAFAPGAGQEQLVNRGMRFWAHAAHERGWILVSPVHTEGDRFENEGYQRVRPVMDWLRNRYRIEGDGFHVVGASLGGVAAYGFAVQFRDQVHSLTTLPGRPNERTWSNIFMLGTGRPIVNFVGERDESYLRFLATMRPTVEGELGMDYTQIVLPGEGHVLYSLEGGERIFDTLEEHRVDRVRMREEEREVSAVLTDFHAAAAEADLRRYFSHFAPHAVFIGTDAGERWTTAQFLEYAQPRFADGGGWTYTAHKRHITVLPLANIAWFDEMLENERMGVTRGSGVLRRIGDRWRITHYHLDLPVPNELADTVVEMIRVNREPEATGP